MVKELYGKVVKGVGGLYETDVVDGGVKTRITSRAKGILKRDEEKVLVGDNVTITVDDSIDGGVVISEVQERKNSLIRPPLANLDYIFIVFAAKKPSPVIETVDKLIAIAEHNRIIPVIVITKADLSPSLAEEFAAVYRAIGIDTFITSSLDFRGTDELKRYITERVRDGVTAAFAGASGVGKSTLMNAIFEGLTLATGDISRKIERGKHTTRHVELFPVGDGGYLADTPGFSLVDFARFDFFSLEELQPAFREFADYVGKCRYADCAHFGEGADECAIARAVKEGKIPESRLLSYRAIYEVLHSKSKYD